MMKIFLNLVVLCTFHLCITSGQNPNATDDDKCSDVFKYLYISGLPVINNWKYEITSNGFVRCQSTYKYSSPQALELGCHSKIQSLLFTKLNIRTPTEDGEAVYSRNSDIFLNIAINAKQHNESTIYCQSLDRINYTTRSVIVELIYEPNKELPENRRRRLFLEKTISFAINTRADGDVCTIYTWLPIYSGPLMIEILGNYDHLDHF
ncbi:uncharacterized protein LOC113238847, partial [Hyposmocoma kahamanoa]|uniref:uncharacterized protein LOC113238847 n=1 Tax=Hyposmocoma kahamanoa TaxID=1477025 RepID=UPI000E6D6891